jgi:hypothetical protein
MPSSLSQSISEKVLPVKIKAVAVVLAALGLNALALGDVAVLTSGRDNTLYESAAGDISNGAGTGMFAGRSNAEADSIRRGLVWFDVAAQIPAGSTITSATLSLYQSSANTQPISISVHRSLESWGEGTSVGGGGGGGGGAAATAGDATWLFRSFPGMPWATPGGSFQPAASATSNVAGAGTYSWSSPQLLADIQQLLDSPATNFGWIILGDESAPGTAKRFATREETILDRRPMLMVEYTPIPAPGGFMFLSAASFSLLRRKRR